MSAVEVASLSVALLSLFISGLAAYGTYALSHHQLRLGSRNEFQKMLLELDKELIRDPELWSVYDAHPMAEHPRDEPAYRAKLEAFAFMCLNIFQIVFVYSRDRGERLESWWKIPYNGVC